MKPQQADNTAASLREQHDFYREVLKQLNSRETQFLVGGGYALEQCAGVLRNGDLDVLVQPADVQTVMKNLREVGYRTELCAPHWLGKIIGGGYFVDLIFNSGNGVCEVESSWFEHAVAGQLFGSEVKFCAPEELIWSKAFVMERERFDGADIAHIIRARGAQLDWPRLLKRFEAHGQVLLSHLVLFDFIYPSERSTVPSWVTRTLLDRIQAEKGEPSSRNRVCRGTLLSRSQYRVDIERWGYQDARHRPAGPMTPEDAASWSAAAEDSTL